eukprot:360958-Chlamydomonas_euryale.AAC.9
MAMCFGHGFARNQTPACCPPPPTLLPQRFPRSAFIHAAIAQPRSWRAALSDAPTIISCSAAGNSLSGCLDACVMLIGFLACDVVYHATEPIAQRSSAPTLHRHARVFWPSTFIAHEPQMPSRQERRRDRV